MLCMVYFRMHRHSTPLCIDQQQQLKMIMTMPMLLQMMIMMPHRHGTPLGTDQQQQVRVIQILMLVMIRIMTPPPPPPLLLINNDNIVCTGTARIDMQLISNSNRKTVHKAALDTAQFAGTAAIPPPIFTSEWL